jgi:hypothetical protein
MPNSPPAHVRARDNRTLPCEARHCTRRRVWTSAYCKRHRDRKTLYGHPEARHIKRSEWQAHYEAVRSIFRQYPRHPSLLAAGQIMGLLLDPGLEPRRRHHRDACWLRWRETRRLRGIKPRRALQIACAVWCLIRECPALLPNDGACLDYAIAHAVLRMRRLTGYRSWSRRTDRLVKDVTPPSALVVGPLGQAIREHLALFFTQVSDALARQRDDRNRALVSHQQHLVP